ncbi:MAG: polysaccharide deacetylase family protein [Rhizobiales bacterium]|nr:polysaccharide deacetylase family protein [Hyphomicrobiales bacterium]
MTKTLLITVNVHGLGPEAAEAPGAALHGRFAHGGYAYRIGLDRLLETLRRDAAPATFFWPSSEALRVPALLERCLREGHEVASHGRAFEDHAKLAPAEEADILGEARDTLARLAGTRPTGFRSPTGTLSAATIGLLRSLDYRYDSSFLDDDAPYGLDADGGAGMVELPWSEGLTDATHFRRRLTQDRAEAFLTEEFDALLPVAGYACLTLHPRADIGLARASRLPILERLIARARDAGATLRHCRDLA